VATVELKSAEQQCDGRYPVPQTSPPREEATQITYRCGQPAGHTGEHGPRDAPLTSNLLLDRLLEASVGGCSCLTKTPELQYHSPTCHFRLHEESSREIKRLTRELDRTKSEAGFYTTLAELDRLRAALEVIADERWTRDAIGYRRLASEALRGADESMLQVSV
jgi:hypothetical protein